MAIKIRVKLTGEHKYEAPAFGAPWKMENRYIYTFSSEDGTVYVWKTSTFFVMEVPAQNPERANWYDRKGNPVDHDAIHKGDDITISCTVKGLSEYKGQQQTEISRVKVVERHFRAERDYERKARIEAEQKAKREAQMASLEDGDQIIEMWYSRYKQHFSDCEILAGSYGVRKDARGYAYGNKTVKVIVRAGRMKKSGVRGENFHEYHFSVTVDGIPTAVKYRAISEENARKRLAKDMPWAADAPLAYVSRCSNPRKDYADDYEDEEDE